MESPAPAYTVQASPYFPINVSEVCAEGVCSPLCFMFCFPFPPPPPYDMMSRESGDTTFSPLVIAIIGILVSAILLVTYYTLVAKYCRNWDEFRRRLHRASGERFDDDDVNPNAAVESWPVFRDGLEEAVINSIPVHKYKKGDGFVDCSDCSVCLSEFKEDETVRLLPKCSHAFHVPCIDKWLNSHSNCPLCRANIVAPVPEGRVSTVDSFRENIHSFRASEPHSSRFDERDMNKELIEVSVSSAAVIPGFRAMSDLATTHRWRNSETEVDLEDALRRSFSVDSKNAFGKFGAEDQDGVIASSCERRHPYFKGLWKQKDKLGETSSKSGILHHVKDPLAMKRSFSGSKLFLSRNRNSILPL